MIEGIGWWGVRVAKTINISLTNMHETGSWPGSKNEVKRAGGDDVRITTTRISSLPAYLRIDDSSLPCGCFMSISEYHYPSICESCINCRLASIPRRPDRSTKTIPGSYGRIIQVHLGLPSVTLCHLTSLETSTPPFCYVVTLRPRNVLRRGKECAGSNLCM